MKKYRLEKSKTTGTYYLINSITRKEGGLFTTHEEGIELIRRMVFDKAIAVAHAIELYSQITHLDIPTCIITDEFKNQIIEKRIVENLTIIATKALFENMLVASDCDVVGPKLVIFDHDQIYGAVFFKEGRTRSFNSQAEGLHWVEQMYDDKIINLIEKERLENEIMQSKLPKNDPSSIARMN